MPPTTPRTVTDGELNDEGINGYNNNDDNYEEIDWNKAGKPQVWIRLRPPPKYDDNVFEIGQDRKSLRLLVEPKDRILKKMKDTKDINGNNKGLTFTVDGILQSSSQEDAYRVIVNEVVDKAINGVNGAIISLGPEISGKSFTMFGYFSKFEYRGIIPRALERIFQLVDARCNEINYIVRIGIIELRRDRIRDLLTLGPYELQHVGENGPYGMLLQQIGCAEHGLGLLIRALAGQKSIPRESFAQYHTVVYIDIHGETFTESRPRIIKSRITFAKIASIPQRSKNIVRVGSEVPAPFDGFIEADGCVYARPSYPVKQNLINPPVNLNPTCCRIKSGPLIEAIGVRRDLSFLEQMFIGANELRNLNKYYGRLKSLGMTSLVKRPNLTPSQYFRQSKLAHCLQDIVAGCTEIRIILHIRPEKQYLQTTLEAIRFAERAKCIPYDFISIEQKHDEPDVELLKHEIFLLHEELQNQDRLFKRAQELSDICEPLSPSELRTVQQQATEYFDGRTDTINITSKAQARATFECLRQLWKNISEKETTHPLKNEIQEEVLPFSAHNNKVKKTKSRRTSNNKRKKDTRGSATLQPVTQAKEDLPRDLSLSGDSIKHPDENTEPILEIETTVEYKGTVDIARSHSGLSIGNELVKSNVDDNNKNIFRKSVGHDGQQNGIPNIQHNINTAAVIDQKEPPTKTEAWHAFLKTKQGLTLFQDLNRNDISLKDSTIEHNETLRKVTSLLSKLNQFQADLDIIQQERHLRGDEYDDSGNVILTPQEKDILRDIKALQSNRDELLERLQNLRLQLHDQKRVVEIRRNENEVAFQSFCLECYAVAFGKDDSIISSNLNPNIVKRNKTIHHLIVQNEENTEKHFNELKRLARQQAKQLLRSYPRRPPWDPY